jgi:hypothetical protein
MEILAKSTRARSASRVAIGRDRPMGASKHRCEYIRDIRAAMKLSAWIGQSVAENFA